MKHPILRIPLTTNLGHLGIVHYKGSIVAQQKQAKKQANKQTTALSRSIFSETVTFWMKGISSRSWISLDQSESELFPSGVRCGCLENSWIFFRQLCESVTGGKTPHWRKCFECDFLAAPSFVVSLSWLEREIGCNVSEAKSHAGRSSFLWAAIGMAYSKDLIILKRFSNWLGVSEKSHKAAF